RGDHVFDVKKGRAVEADIDEGRLHAGEDACDLPQVHVAHRASIPLALEIELGQDAVLDQRYAHLADVDADHDRIVRHRVSLRSARRRPPSQRCGNRPSFGGRATDRIGAARLAAGWDEPNPRRRSAPLTSSREAGAARRAPLQLVSKIASISARTLSSLRRRATAISFTMSVRAFSSIWRSPNERDFSAFSRYRSRSTSATS